MGKFILVMLLQFLAMKLLVPLGCFAILINGSPLPRIEVDHTSKIIGGQEATPHQFPWQISLQYHIFSIGLYRHRCGATIIDETHIVCAAHCIDGQTKGHFRVLAGAHDLHPILPDSARQIRKVSQMWQHEGFDKDHFNNDVSVLELDEPLEFNDFVQPIRIADIGQNLTEGTECINSGWGVTDDGRIAEKLQYVMLPIVDQETCVADYSEINAVDEGMLCAGQAEGGFSPCQGDSGGPLVCPGEDGEYFLAGIVSWGVVPCGQPNLPGVFTNAGYFRDWIHMHVTV